MSRSMGNHKIGFGFHGYSLRSTAAGPKYRHFPGVYGDGITKIGFINIKNTDYGRIAHM